MSLGFFKLDENKQIVPCDVREYGEWASNPENNRVGSDEVNGLWVSTVFLGLDHSLGGESQWFETMVFSKEADIDYVDLYCDRYSTWEEAERGHQSVVDCIVQYPDEWDEKLRCRTV